MSLKEPDFNNHAFIFARNNFYYVEYEDGVSQMMPKENAEDYAEIFGGIVKKHSMAPKWWQFWRYEL